jgi:hypothetical protein
MLEQYGQDITLCPKCKTCKLQLIAIVYPTEKFIKLSIITADKKSPALQNKASPTGKGPALP